MTTTTFVESQGSVKLAEDILLRSVIDPEFRHELLSNSELLIAWESSSRSIGADSTHLKNNLDTTIFELPKPVSPQDMSFVELVKETADINAQQCISTCVSGFTIICDGNTINPGCRNTCISGYTIRCDGQTL